MYYLKKFIIGFGDFVYSIFENVIPDSVKGKLKSLGTSISAGDFKMMVLAIFKLILHWYFLMVTVSIIVLYRLYNALEQTGVLDKFEKIVTKAIISVFYISEHCFPYMLQLKEFFNCVQGAP